MQKYRQAGASWARPWAMIPKADIARPVDKRGIFLQAKYTYRSSLKLQEQLTSL